MNSKTISIELPYARHLLHNEETVCFAHIRKTLKREIHTTNYCFDTCKTTFDAVTKTLTFIFGFIGCESTTMAPLESMRAPIQAIVETYRFPTFEDDPEAFATYTKMCENLDAERKHAFDMLLLQCVARLQSNN